MNVRQERQIRREMFVQLGRESHVRERFGNHNPSRQEMLAEYYGLSEEDALLRLARERPKLRVQIMEYLHDRGGTETVR